MNEPFTLKRSRQGKENGGGERLQVGQRVRVMIVIATHISDDERHRMQGMYGKVVAIEPNGVPTFRMDSGRLISGSETRWVRADHVF